MTIYEQKGSLTDKKLAFIGDGNNMAHSLLIGCAIMGVDCSVGVPEGYEVNEDILALAKEKAKQSGAWIEQVHDPIAAVTNADVIYTDVWTRSEEHTSELQSRGHLVCR